MRAAAHCTSLPKRACGPAGPLGSLCKLGLLRHNLLPRLPRPAASNNDEPFTPLSAPEPAAPPPPPQQQPEASSSVPYSVVAGLAGAGVAETAYLTWVKLAGTTVVCPLSGCATVLDSAYASLYGVPLSLLGMMAYGAVGACAVAAQLQPDSSRRSLDTALAAGTALLAGVSGYLIYLLQTEFAGSPCAWCYLSATLSLSLAASVISGLPAKQLQQVAAPSAGTLAAAVVALSLGTAGASNSTADNFELPFKAPEVTSTSTEQAVALSRRLRDSGARMYGAFWCSHCLDQKQDFGREAMADFPYVECFPTGWKKGIKEAAVCEEAGVRAFPTWVINGKNVEGELTFEELEKELDGRSAQQ